MEASFDLALARGVRLERAAPVQPAITERACRGPQCPIFDACRGRCAVKRTGGEARRHDLMEGA